MSPVSPQLRDTLFKCACHDYRITEKAPEFMGASSVDKGITSELLVTSQECAEPVTSTLQLLDIRLREHRTHLERDAGLDVEL